MTAPLTITPLPRSFYERDAVALARALLGRTLVHATAGGVVAGRIVETEAYRGPTDRAAHTFGGRRTPRNEVMWGPAGHAYVYFVYGMHFCLNAVAAGEGIPEAVLLRAAEPLEGVALARSRRGRDVADALLLSGPANLCRALGVDRSRNGADLTSMSTGSRTLGALVIADGEPVPPRRIRATPRIGVAYAGPDARRPWRFVVAGSAAVSGPPSLRR